MEIPIRHAFCDDVERGFRLKLINQRDYIGMMAEFKDAALLPDDFFLVDGELEFFDDLNGHPLSSFLLDPLVDH